MKKRIYISFFIQVLLCALMISASVSIIIYNATRDKEMHSIRDRAILVAEILNNTDPQNLSFYFSSYDPDAARITLIAYDGTVLLDNKANPENLANHGDREEFREAVERGRSESMRFSDTINSDTYYYAIRLDSGNVLRVSKTMDRISGVFTDVLLSLTGITIVVLILSGILASRLTKNIITPLNQVDFDKDNPEIYDELVPYVRKISQQRSEIDDKISMLNDRADMVDKIIGNMKEGLILIDKTGVILSINKSASKVLGGGDLIGINIQHVNRDIDFQSCVKECLSGVDSEITIRRNEKTYDVYFSPVQDFEITGGVILFQNKKKKNKSEKQHI